MVTMGTENSLKQILQLLSDGDADAAVATIEEVDIDINYRDVTHDLQTLPMRMCYINLCVNDLERVLAAIFEKAPDVNIQDSWGRTVLMHACIANKPGYIEGLLGYEETDITIVDFDGNTALSYAVQNCDIYTLEDILNITDGGTLITKHNAKGHSPLSIAQKSGDKSVITLFESYINKSVCLQDKKKQRKPRNRDVIRLPLAYSPSPERKAQCSSSGHLTNRSMKSSLAFQSLPNSPSTRRNTERHFAPRHTHEKVDLNLSMSSKELYSKSDSAPLIRKSISLENEERPSLTLTSAKLSRHHYKRDSLYHQSTSLQSPRALPDIESTDATWDKIPENHIRKQRRPSVSLPDLRLAGSLVQSSGSSPDSEENGHSKETSFQKETEDEDQDDDNVFSSSYPTAKLFNSVRCSKQSDRQLTLPEISQHRSSKLSQNLNKNKNISPLARTRKFSNSDDHLNRTVLLQGSS